MINLKKKLNKLENFKLIMETKHHKGCLMLMNKEPIFHENSDLLKHSTGDS